MNNKRFSCDGMWGTKFHTCWKNMKRRSNMKEQANSNRSCYNHVTLCERWKVFRNFKDDMLKSYEGHVAKFGEKETSIDRIDNNKGYSPENCRWATKQEQTNNRRNVKLYTYDGKTMNLKQWAEHLGVYRSVLANRVSKGWEDHQIFTARNYRGQLITKD